VKRVCGTKMQPTCTRAQYRILSSHTNSLSLSISLSLFLSFSRSLSHPLTHRHSLNHLSQTTNPWPLLFHSHTHILSLSLSIFLFLFLFLLFLPFLTSFSHSLTHAMRYPTNSFTHTTHCKHNPTHFTRSTAFAVPGRDWSVGQPQS